MAKPSSISNKWPIGIRILAIFLAVFIIFEIILTNLASIKFSTDNYKGTEQEQAAEIIEQNDGYLSSDDLQRMRAVIATLGEPKTYDQYSLFSSVAIADEDYEKAILYFQKSIELFEGSDKELSQQYVKLACLYALNNDWNNALVYSKQGIEKDSLNSDAQLMLCESYLNIGDYEMALNALKTFSKNSTLDEDQISAMIQLQISLGQYDDALETCKKAIESNLYNTGQIEIYMAQCYLSLGDTKNAKSYAEKSILDGGDKTQADTIIAVSAESDGDIKSAYIKAKEIIESGDADSIIYNLVCQYAYTLGDYDNLIKYSEEALNKSFLSEEKITFNKWLGVGQLETSQFEKAEQNLTKYLDFDSTIPEVFYLRGLCFMALEKFTSAENDFTTALSSEDLFDECLYNRALCRIKLNKDDEAAKDFEEIIVRNKDDEVIKLTCELLSLDESALELIRNNSNTTISIDNQGSK